MQAIRKESIRLFKIISIMTMSLNEYLFSQYQNQQPRISSTNHEKIDSKPPQLLMKIKEYFLNDVQTCPRKIFLSGKVTPINNQKNIVRNTKYNVFSFIPLVIKNQFSHFFNLFFLANAIIQLCPYFRVGLFFTCIGPLLLVLFLTMCKEGYEDFKTYQRDTEANSKLYDVLTAEGYRRTRSEDLKVGDIVKIVGGDRIPADMLILHSEGSQGQLFIKTDQLDGETDWKLRKAIKATQSLIRDNQQLRAYLQPDIFCKVEQPSGQIYEFDGMFKDSQKLTLQNTMWASTVLTNGVAHGLVMYVGKETRISMGGSNPRTKFGIIDNELNRLSKFLFFIMVILAGVFLALQRTQLPYVPIQFVRIIVLLSSIIPISLRVNLDFAKFYYAMQINRDRQIPGTVVRNTNCPEQLGRVKYILSDKTGTLTKNEMLFKQISIDNQLKFTNEQIDKMKDILAESTGTIENRSPRQNELKNIVLALALCHNVTPIFSQNQNETTQYQASSPDEVAFVKLAENLGITITERTHSSITLCMPNDRLISYKIMYVFPFKSEAKRMGIILQNTKTSQYLFFLKGADTVMRKFITNKQKQLFIDEQCKNLSETGLRTLIIGCKVLSQDFYKKWSALYQQAYNQFQNDNKDIERLMNELEHGVQFLGITGIQDRLRDGLTMTIQSFRSAKIKIWMITGDKMETAQCISKSCGLQKYSQGIHRIQNIIQKHQLLSRLNAMQKELKKVLIIDGNTLEFLSLQEETQEKFYRVATRLQGLICYRCSPKQKRMITEGLKKYKNEKQAVLCIGDGGNDVGMIQAADVGIGIVGKQGMQAALAADISITEFSDLKNILFWHGRLAYIRGSLLASFIIHRGFIIASIQLIFSCIFHYVTIPVFNSYLQLGYATIFTFWPVFALILSQDVSYQVALSYSQLYTSLQKAEYLSLSNFLVWIWKALFQGAIIVTATLWFFEEDSYLQFQTVCFTVLIITEYFMAAIEMKHLHKYLLLCIVGSFACYAICLFLLKSYLHMASLTPNDWGHILIIFGMSWGPVFIWKIARRQFWRKDTEIIMRNSQSDEETAPSYREIKNGS